MTTYTLTYAAASNPAPIFQKVINDEQSVSLAGAYQSAGRTGNRYQLTLSFVRSRADYMTLMALLDQLHGGRHRLSVPMSKTGYSRQGVGGGTPLVSGAHAAGATTLWVKGLPSTTTGILQPGDWIQIGNQLSRVVTILSTPGTTTSPITPTIASCTIFPELHKAYSDGDTINYSTPSGLFIWRGDSGQAMDHSGIGTVSVDLEQDVLA
jgi:hypothetical protein